LFGIKPTPEESDELAVAAQRYKGYIFSREDQLTLLRCVIPYVDAAFPDESHDYGAFG
jgi:hypothetical protein